MKRILGDQIKFWLIPALIIACQLPLFRYLDVDRQNMNLFALTGYFAIFWLLFTNEIKKSHVLLALPVIMVTVFTLPHWILGHSELRIASFVGLTGIAVLATKSDIGPIKKAFVLSVFIQMAIYHLRLIPWAMPIDAAHYVFGTFRNHIRYGMILIPGIVCGASLLLSRESRYWRALGAIAVVAGSAEVFLSRAQTASALVALFLAIVVYAKARKWKYGKWLVTGGVLVIGTILANVVYHATMSYGLHNGWLNALSHARLGGWEDALESMRFMTWSEWAIGCGADAWNVFYGAHPHCSILEMIYNYGILGLWAIIGFVLCTLWLGLWCRVALVCFSAIVLASLTHSFMYPEQLFMLAIFAGIALRETINSDKGEECIEMFV